jgi:hypothetical protein
MTGEDARLTAHRRRLLERLAANTTNPTVADLARDLLTGRITPREAAASGAFAEEFTKAVAPFTRWYGSLSEAEREDAARQGLERLDEESRAADPDGAGQSPVRAGEEEADYSERTWLRKR